MRLTTISLLVLLLASGEAARADKPATPATRTETIANGKFLFVVLCPEFLETERGKAIRAMYPQGGLYKNDGSKEPLWTIDWYREQVAVLPDGVHMVRYGNWPVRKAGPKDPTIAKDELKQEAVSFFAKGKLLREYPIEELIDDPTKLPRSVSHFRWMKASKLIEDRLQLEVITFDGNRIRFDLASGKIIEKKAD
jgi:hypothetical protein